MKRSSIQQLKMRQGARDAANSDTGLACAQKDIEDNATTKGTIDVQGGSKTTQKGSPLQQGTRNGDLSLLGPPGHSSLSTPEKSYGILALKRDSSGISNCNSGANCWRNAASTSNGARRNRNPQAVSEARRSQPELCMCSRINKMGPRVSLVRTFSKTQHSYSKETPIFLLNNELPLSSTTTAFVHNHNHSHLPSARVLVAVSRVFFELEFFCSHLSMSGNGDQTIWSTQTQPLEMSPLRRSMELEQSRLLPCMWIEPGRSRNETGLKGPVAHDAASKSNQ